MDIILERQTYILVHDEPELLFPASNLYPSDRIYPTNTFIVENIVENTMNLSEILCENQLEFGQLYATKFEVQIYDTEDLSGKYISVFQTENNNSWYVFSGLIDSCKLDRLETDRTLVAYDLAYKTSFVNVADWWTEFWANHSTTTLKAFREALLNYMGIQYEVKAMINDNIQLTKPVDLSSIGFSSLLKMICELSCCFPHFDRNGELKFIVLDTDPTAKEIEEYEGENSEYQEYITNAITGIQFYSRSSDIRATVGTIDNSYDLNENLLINGIDDTTLTTVGTNMLTYMSQLQYRPSNVSMIVSDFQYKLGDYIQTDKSEFYLLKMDFNGVQLIEQKLIANGDSSREGVEVNIPETVLLEDVVNLGEDIEDISDEVDQTISDVSDLYDDVELYKRQFTADNDHIESVISTSGAQTWDESKWESIHSPSTISVIDEGDPTVTYEYDEPQWDTYGITIEEHCDTKPNPKDYDDTQSSSNVDLNKYFMDDSNGDIYQYKANIFYYSSGTITGSITKPKYKVTTKAKYSFYMEKVHDGRRTNTQKIWIVEPDAEVGDHYLDWSNGKVYRLDTNSVGEAPYKWTYIDTCPTKAQTLSTRISQTAHSISLVAQNDTTGKAVGLHIQLYNEDGTLLQDTPNLQFTGLASFTDLENTGTTFINGSHIQTGTLDVGTIQANATYTNPDTGTDMDVIEFSDPIHLDRIYAYNISSVDYGPSETAPSLYLNIEETGQIMFHRSHPFYEHVGMPQRDRSYQSDNELTLELGDGRPVVNEGMYDVTFYEGLGYKGYGPRLDDTSPSGSDFWVTDTSIYCNGPFHYPIFPYLRSSSTTANLRCRNNNYGAPYTEESYTFAPISQSSQRWKHDIKPVEDEILDPHRLYDLEVDQFIFNLDYLEEDDMRYDTPVIGFIAEKVAQVYPIAAEKSTYDGQVENWNERYIIPPMLALIQEQNERIKALEDRLTQLEQKEEN